MLTLAQITAALGIELAHDLASREFTGVKPLDAAGPEHLSFLDNPAYRDKAKASRAGAMLVKPADVACVPATCVALVTQHPYVALAKILQQFHPVPELVAGISAQATVSQSATIHPTARIEPGAVIYAHATLGPRVHIGAHTVIGEGVTVAAGTRIGSHCTLLKCRIGERCILHAGVRIGQDGFGFAAGPEGIIKVPQVGHVVIGNDVEIGANTTIDCGALGDTVIADMVKLDNQVQIAHNVHIGQGSMIAAQTGIAGSTKLGRFVVLGGQVAVAGHLTIADKVQVAGRSGVTKSITDEGATYAGLPAEPIHQWRRRMAAIARFGKKGKSEV